MGRFLLISAFCLQYFSASAAPLRRCDRNMHESYPSEEAHRFVTIDHPSPAELLTRFRSALGQGDVGDALYYMDRGALGLGQSEISALAQQLRTRLQEEVDKQNWAPRMARFFASACHYLGAHGQRTDIALLQQIYEEAGDAHVSEHALKARVRLEKILGSGSSN